MAVISTASLTVAMQDVCKVQVQHGLGNVHAGVEDGAVVEIMGAAIFVIHRRFTPTPDKCIATKRVAEAAHVAVL